jgi:NAD(P)-dependent dehydrogenase (short-subunit alcohol dehydrogenase family)
MEGKVCIVTGANRGLGRATAAGLARLGAAVVLACRRGDAGEAARAAIESETGNPNVELAVVDLSSQDSIRDMVARFLAEHAVLDVLVNNAAVFVRQRQVTAGGLEVMFATNYLASFLLTNLLLDRLRASAPSRIITVTAPSTTKLDFDDLQGERRFRPLWAFGASMTGKLLLTYELARRLERSGVTANAYFPGLMRTDLMRQAPAPIRWLLGPLAPPPEKAADGLVYLASSPDMADVSGAFFKGRDRIDSSSYSHDQDVQRQMWETSVKLTNR